MPADRPLEIAYVWDADYPWDVRTEKICRSLTEHGHRVRIIARNAAWRALEEPLAEGRVLRMRPWRAIGRRFDRLSSFPAFANPRWIAHIARGMRGPRPDVVIVRDLPLAPTALWIGRRHGIPVMLDMAENYPAMMRDLWISGRASWVDTLVRNPAAVSAVERYVLPRVDHLITVVEESSERAATLGVAPERMTVVSNTPPAARVVTTRAPARSGGPLRLAYLGLMEVPRGILGVLEAVAAVTARGLAVELTLIGDGRDRARFEQHAATLGLAPPTVRFLGALPNAEALRLVGEADVGLVPHHAVESWHTTIPNKLFDYMAAGLPVVTSDARPAARVVRETGAGLVYAWNDPLALAGCLEQLADPALRDRLGAAGRQAIRERFNWENDVRALLGAIARVLP